jgi:hypothetical protein
LHSGVVGDVIFDPTRFQVEPPDYFELQLLDLLETALRDKEANVRLIIGHYISHAVKQARKQFALPKLAFASKFDVTPEIIPNVGIVSGALDFVCVSIQTEAMSMFSFITRNNRRALHDWTKWSRALCFGHTVPRDIGGQKEQHLGVILIGR